MSIYTRVEYKKNINKYHSEVGKNSEELAENVSWHPVTNNGNPEGTILGFGKAVFGVVMRGDNVHVMSLVLKCECGVDD